MTEELPFNIREVSIESQAKAHENRDQRYSSRQTLPYDGINRKI
jgi:hypothetical protein